MNSVLVKKYTSGGVIAPYSFVKFGANRTVVQAAAATDMVIGITGQLGAAEAGVEVNITHIGIDDLKLAGNVNAGQHVMSNAAGLGVALVVAAGNYSGAIALDSGVSGDIIPVMVSITAR
ncbi:MAG TPA: hypothetical protein VHO70_12920 [Chitinispirillaceae bacterium]|nr:hypothetical protein [Chitinispirillaceae bacterium]